ncbi:hypothetical protein HPG69_005738, partial [Diceros bicornis minor]
ALQSSISLLSCLMFPNSARAPTYFVMLNVTVATLLQLVRDVPGSVDKGSICHCVVHLPKDLIRMQQLEQLRSTAQELMGKYEQELSRVANANLTLKLLAESDQRSFHAVSQDVDVLEGQLSECEREKEQEEASGHPCTLVMPKTEFPKISSPQGQGSCAHGGLQNIPRPLVMQLNWIGFSYKAGAWGPDSAPNPASSLYWPGYSHYYWLHKCYDDLVLLKKYEQWKTGYGDCNGNALYNNFMYFNYYGTGDMAKVDLFSNTLVLWHPLPGATYKNHFSYASVPWKDLDFAHDEKHLWVLYATKESKGNLVVSCLSASTLEVEKPWHTSQYEPALSGAFMACGLLYAVCSLSTHQGEIFYGFDTSTRQKRHLSILLDKMLETLHGINY